MRLSVFASEFFQPVDRNTPMHRFLKLLSHPASIVAIILATVGTAVVLPIYRDYRQTQMAIAELEDGRIPFRADVPDWCGLLPDPIANRCGPYFERVTRISSVHSRDVSLSLITSCDCLESLTIGTFDFGVAMFDRESGITDDEMEFLAGLKNLQELHIGSPRVSDAGLVHLKNCDALEGLWLNFPQMTDDGLKNLSRMQNLKSLQLFGYQFLSKSRLHGHGLRYLRDARGLTELFISDHAINDEGMAELANFPNLQKLSLISADVTDAGLAHLAGLHSLQELDLSERTIDSPVVRITDAGLRHLAGLSNLQSLLLDGSGVSTAGVAELLNAVGGIEHLSLNYTNIGDDDVDALLSLPRTPTLLWLEIDGTEITAEGRARIRTAYPKI